MSDPSFFHIYNDFEKKTGIKLEFLEDRESLLIRFADSNYSLVSNTSSIQVFKPKQTKEIVQCSSNVQSKETESEKLVLIPVTGTLNTNTKHLVFNFKKCDFETMSFTFEK